MMRSMIVLCVLATMGCGGTTFVNKKYRGRLSRNTDHLAIMPVEAHRFPKGLRSGIESIMNHELESSFGSRGVQVMHVRSRLAPAGFANLGWRLALGMCYRAREHGDPKLDGDYYEWLDELPGEAFKFMGWLKTALAGVAGARGELRYILTAYVERLKNQKTKRGEPRITFRVMAGIFDARQGRIVVSTWKYLRAKPSLNAIGPLLKGIGTQLRKRFRPVYR